MGSASTRSRRAICIALCAPALSISVAERSRLDQAMMFYKLGFGWEGGEEFSGLYVQYVGGALEDFEKPFVAAPIVNLDYPGTFL